MQNIITKFSKLKDNLESVAFLISKGNSEQEAHSKIVQGLVLLSQIESECKSLLSDKNLPGKDTSKGKATLTERQQNYVNVKSSANRANKAEIEVKKVKRRIPKWFKNPGQCNSTILYAFLMLSEKHDRIIPQMLRTECSALSDFDGNYNQMKNFGEKNHGKVFEEANGIITLWEPVKKYILELYKQHKGSLHN